MKPLRERGIFGTKDLITLDNCTNNVRVKKLPINQSFVNNGFNHCPLHSYYSLMS